MRKHYRRTITSHKFPMRFELLYQGITKTPRTFFSLSEEKKSVKRRNSQVRCESTTHVHFHICQAFCLCADQVDPVLVPALKTMA